MCGLRGVGGGGVGGRERSTERKTRNAKLTGEELLPALEQQKTSPRSATTIGPHHFHSQREVTPRIGSKLLRGVHQCIPLTIEIHAKVAGRQPPLFLLNGGEGSQAAAPQNAHRRTDAETHAHAHIREGVGRACCRAEGVEYPAHGPAEPLFIDSCCGYRSRRCRAAGWPTASGTGVGL